MVKETSKAIIARGIGTKAKYRITDKGVVRFEPAPGGRWYRWPMHVTKDGTFQDGHHLFRIDRAAKAVYRTEPGATRGTYNDLDPAEAESNETIEGFNRSIKPYEKLVSTGRPVKVREPFKAKEPEGKEQEPRSEPESIESQTGEQENESGEAMKVITAPPIEPGEYSTTPRRGFLRSLAERFFPRLSTRLAK